MFGNGFGIGMETIHPQSKSIRREPKQARLGSTVVGRGATARGTLVSPTAAAVIPLTAEATFVFVCVGPAFSLSIFRVPLSCPELTVWLRRSRVVRKECLL